jgi:arsenate reductase
MITVLFACVHNAGRSQIAAALFNQYVDPAKARAISAGTHPAARVHPEVVAAMTGRGLALSAAPPRKLTPELAATAQWLITMGCGDECPVVPGAQREDWPIQDPKGQAPATVDRIIDDIGTRVAALIDAQRWRSSSDHRSL